MQHSKRSLEGYMMVDHRQGPGLSDDFLHNLRKIFPEQSILPYGQGRGLFEAPLLRCSHCQKQIIMNPARNLAVHPREICHGCGRYICDRCTVLKKIGVQCKPIERVIDEVLAEAAREQAIKEI